METETETESFKDCFKRIIREFFTGSPYYKMNDKIRYSLMLLFSILTFSIVQLWALENLTLFQLEDPTFTESFIETVPIFLIFTLCFVPFLAYFIYLERIKYNEERIQYWEKRRGGE
jgi:hypothetical protein